MDNQVRFYSISASGSPSDANGIYFQNGGHIYKGTSRFGATKVFTVSNADDLAPDSETTTGKVEGDVAVGYGAARIWDGNQWLPLENINQQKALVSLMTSGLVVGGSGYYITGITQDENGNVTAQASPFPGGGGSAIGSATESGEGNGIVVSVTTESGIVTSVQVAATSLEVNEIEASSATFSNINVTNSATFSTTYVSASFIEADAAQFGDINVSGSATFSVTEINTTSFTVGGSTVNEIVQDELDGTIVTIVAASTSAANNKIPSELAVRNAIDEALSSAGGGGSEATLVWIDVSGQPIT